MSGGATINAEFGPGMLLEPGFYDWVLWLDGETRSEWRQRFYVRAKPDEYAIASV